MWFIGVEVEQETSAPPPKKNPGSAPVLVSKNNIKSWNILFLLLVRDLVKWALMLKKEKKKTDP